MIHITREPNLIPLPDILPFLPMIFLIYVQFRFVNSKSASLHATICLHIDQTISSSFLFRVGTKDARHFGSLDPTPFLDSRWTLKILTVYCLA